MNRDWIGSLMGMALISALVWADGLPFLHDAPLLLLVAGGALLANLEFAQMATRRNLQPPLTVMQFLALIVCGLVYYLRVPEGSNLVLTIVTILLAFFTLVITNALLAYWPERSRSELGRDFLAALVVSLGVSGLLSHALGLESLAMGVPRLAHGDALRLVLGALWIAWGSGALMSVVRRAPVFIALAAGALLGALLARPMLSLEPLPGAWLGLTLGVAAGGGRSLATWLRDRFGVPSTGALLPGYGGFWDRFDTILFALPVAYWAYRLLLF